MSITPNDKQPIRFQPAAINTGATTIQTGTKLVTVKKNGVPIQAGDIKLRSDASC